MASEWFLASAAMPSSGMTTSVLSNLSVFDNFHLPIKSMSGKVAKHDEQKKFILNYLDDLYRYAMSLCHNQTDAEDLVSNTVLKAIESAENLHDKTKVKPWLFRILSNQFIDQRRKSKRFPHLPLGEQEDEPERFSLYEAVKASSFTENGTPEKALLQKFLDEDIQQAISELPEVFRVALVLSDKEELSYQEIAGILGVPIGTVRSRIARGRTILQQKLWLQAQEMGIRTRAPKESKEKECACGKEETASGNQLTEIGKKRVLEKR
ncbi:MAG TPA: sigma-70 family RNA polymerase sigma factor [Chitinophagales bacterium]|nr:sigma-70 family RNA polymerase sigma factor [Chitinophagales bacterium]